MKNMKKVFLGLFVTLGLAACASVTPTSQSNLANNKKVESVVLDVSGEIVMEKGQTITATPTITYQDGQEVDCDKIWTSSRPKVASVDNGVVTALGVGSSKISFIAGLKMAYFTVTIQGESAPVNPDDGGETIDPVEPGVTSISLSTASRTLEVGESFTLSVTLTNPDGLDETVVFRSEDANIASVDDAGLVLGKAEGTTSIVVEALGKTAKCEITVVEQKGEDEGDDYDFTVFFFIDYNNIDENDETGNKLLAKFGWYHNEPIGNSGKVPADLTPDKALDPAFPYFVGWSTHTIIDTKADLIDLNTYVVENAHFLFIYGIWSDVPTMDK